MCGAGLFITEYDEKMEGHTWHYNAREYSAGMEELAVRNSRFVQMVLQASHDKAVWQSETGGTNAFLPAYEQQLIERLRNWIGDNWVGDHPVDAALVIPSNEVLEMQELLNISVAHIRKQGEPSISSGACRYRSRLESGSPNELQCGAGPFIEAYERRMDRLGGWCTVVANYAGEDNVFNPLAVKHALFVQGVLQTAHDRAAFREPDSFLASYESELRFALTRYQLDHLDARALYIPRQQ
jgi:hypothetical protein